MKKILTAFAAIALCIAVISCGSKKDSAASLGQQWCELNGKAAKAAEGPEKEAAEAALEKYENELEAKYKDNDAFIKEVQQEAEKCEDASEGR